MEHHIGDVIYALSYLKYRGNESLVLFNGWSGHMTKKMYDFVSPLPLSQSYINNVTYCPFPFPTPLAGFRHWLRWFSLPESFFYAYGESKENTLKFIRENTWLDNIQPKFQKRILTNRTGRYYHSSYFKNLSLFDQNEIGFIGLDYEYERFINDSGLYNVEHVKISNLLEVAEVIQGAELLIGEASSPVAIAQGLGKPCICFCNAGNIKSVNFMGKTTIFEPTEKINKVKLFSFLSENNIAFNLDSLANYDSLFR